MRLAAFLCVVCLAGHASAQSESTVLAQSLFEEGRALMAAGKYAEACPKLEESQRLDPGGGTLLNLASCHEKQGRIATAWGEYNEAASIARRDGRTDREREATARIQALEPALRRASIAVDPKNPEDLEIELDGRKLSRAAWGTAIPLDPGTHEVSASAPGRESWTQSFELTSDGQTRPIAVPELAKVSEEPPVPVAHPPPVVAPDKRDRSPKERPERSVAPPISALVAAGVGVIGFGVGTYFGLKALDEKGKSDDRCEGDACDPTGLEYNEDAQRDAWISNAGIGVGVIATGLAAYFWLSASPKSEGSNAGPRVGVGMHRGRGTLGMRGTFW